jgi:glycosyltransferase involved in cell wall biosynthesis
MSRIVIDARELRTSSGRYVERLLHYLQQLDDGHDYTVLLKPADYDGWHPINPRFHKVECPHKEFTFAEQFGLKRQVRGEKPDLVHFTFAHQPIWYRGKTVTTIHDLTTARFNNPDKNTAVFKFKQQVYKYVVKRAARKAEQVIVPSEFVKNDVADFTGIAPAKVTVTYEAADPIAEAADPIIGLEGERFIMYVGRPTPHKNLDRLIEAFVLLKAQHPDLLLVLAGKKDANYERLEAELRRRTIKNVVFTGQVSEGRLRWLYENCVAYIFPSLSEGFGLPGLEAMVHGAPVVSSNATCLPEIYGDAAHYFDPLDIRAMSDAINEVLTDKKLRADLVKKGAVQAKKYSWERMARQTLNIYNKALEQ